MRPFFYSKKQGRRKPKTPPLPKRWAIRPTRIEEMIIFSAVKLKELFKKERDYPWQKPEGCQCCNSHRLWGHGFVGAIFDGYDQPLLLKLYRCPDCGCVIRLRPKGHFKRFQAPVETIRSSIRLKSTSNRWLAISIVCRHSTMRQKGAIRFPLITLCKSC